jgi:hypothetical protein
MNTNDPYQQFFSLLHEGNLIQAIQLILPAPEIRYETLGTNNNLFTALVNYVDASVFGNFYTTFQTVCHLAELVKQEQRRFPNFQRIHAQIILNADRLYNNMKEQRVIHSNQTIPISDTLLPYLGNYQHCIHEQEVFWLGWLKFQEAKPALAELYSKQSEIFTCPWYPLRYPQQIPAIQFDQNELPLLFLEPLTGNYSQLLAPLLNREALVVFEDSTALMQLLQYPEVVEFLCMPQHHLYLMDIYPNRQLLLQGTHKLQLLPIQIALTAPQKWSRVALPLLIEGLVETIRQTEEALHHDSEPSDWLYKVAERQLITIRQTRLGIDRAPAMFEQLNDKQWNDIHKGTPAKGRDLGPKPEDYMKIKLSQLSQVPVYTQRKPKIAHVVPQIIDGGHAPSHLLEALITNHDHSSFDILLINTERHCQHPADYPYKSSISKPSDIRAPNRIKLFRSLGVQEFTVKRNYSYEQTAQIVAAHMQDVADVVVFHGPDVINSMCAQLIAIPTRVLFEHGTQPSYPGFDIVIASSAGALDIYKDLYSSLNVHAVALPFNLDFRAGWNPIPPTKKQLGLPENCLVMTTISNHLIVRLSSEMLQCIVNILKRVPRAFYAPMGIIMDSHKEKLMRFFADHHLENRVKFLGSIKTPGQAAQAMDLYLNEFPFGGCLGILDAMAAGCPVVTMYDLQGPPQARYGGEFIGIDRSITSCDKEQYIELACKLLTDTEMRKEWSRHVLQCYEKHSDVKAYVKSFEEIIFSRPNQRNQGYFKDLSR